MRRFLRNFWIGFLSGLLLALLAALEPIHLLRETAHDAKQLTTDLRTMFLGK